MNLKESIDILLRNGYILDEAEISGNWSKTLLDRLVAMQQRVKGLQLVKDKKKPYIIHVMMGDVHEVGYIETQGGASVHFGRYDAEAVLIKNGKKIFMENGDYTAEEVYEEFKNEIERYMKMSESYRINEDTETNDDEYDALTDEMEKDPTWWKNDISKSLRTKLNKRTKLYNRHANLEDKANLAANFNIKNFFNGILKGLSKSYKNVQQEVEDYDDETKSQLVRYYFMYKKNAYGLEVMYYDEDGVVNLAMFEEDKIGIERDDFSVSTIDNAIEQVLDFANYNAV